MLTMYRELVFIIFTTICIGKIITLPASETTTDAQQDLEGLCQQSCSKPNWEFRLTGMTCICWVDDAIDDLDAEAMKSAASKQGLKLLIIPKTTRVKRDTINTTEESIQSTETTTDAQQDIEGLCQQSCSKPNWEFRLTGSTCICWVDDAIDDLDAEAMKSAASKQGLKLWVIPKTTRVKRDTFNTTEEAKQSTETTPIAQLTSTPQSPKPDQIQETQPRMSDVDDLKDSKILKKFRTTTETTEKGTLQRPSILTHDSLLGDSFHKSFKTKLAPNRRQIRGCTADSVKLSLQGLKQHAVRLLDRADQASFTCALLVPELETMKLQIQQLINRAGEKKDGSNIFEQIKMREKERHARLQSRLGHFELPKRPHKLNLVGAIHKKDKDNNKENKDSKIIIVQPPELIDDKE